ncbi:hypothetical protein ACX40Y_15375 [Sphingomonas sp. RS6]
MNLRPILTGLGGGIALALLLVPWAMGGVRELNAARTARADLAALAARPAEATSLLPGALALPGGDAGKAQRQMAARLQALARGGGVLVEAIEPVAAPAPMAMLRVRLSGGDKAVIALADAIVRERPLMRFQTWRIAPAEGGGVRLSGEIVAVRR